MLNSCNFIGNLGADPESRRLNSGSPVVNFRLAVSEKWKDGDGNRQERTTWVPVVIFNEGLCKVAENYLRKGSKVYVSGKFSVRKWQDQSGQDRYQTEIVMQGPEAKLVMLDGRSNEDAGQQQEPRQRDTSAGYGAKDSHQRPIDDEDLPF